MSRALSWRPILILIGVQLIVLGLVADLIAVNRKLLEEIQLRVKRVEFRPPSQL